MSECIAEVLTDPIRLEKFLNEYDPAHGAQILFTGVVRNVNFGKKVIGVSYDAFEPLAEKVLLAIGEEARKKWAPLTVKILHRVGRLEVGEISVAVFVSAPHREEAYQASRHVIERLKAGAPIWKKEHYEDTESQWLQGHSLCEGAESYV